ncbi:unnamed protein product, partial [Didymodactylos carnosus]
HIDCKNRAMKCPLCGDTVPTVDIRDHLLMCGNKTELCDRCNKYVLRGIFTYHYENSCHDPDEEGGDIDNLKDNQSRAVRTRHQLVNENDVTPRHLNRTPAELSPSRSLQPGNGTDVVNNDAWSRGQQYTIDIVGNPTYNMVLEKDQNRKVVNTALSNIPQQKNEVKPNDVGYKTTSCEYCNHLIEIRDYTHHKAHCLRNPTTAKSRTRNSDRNNRCGAMATITENDTNISCEYCLQLIGINDLTSHRAQCADSNDKRRKLSKVENSHRLPAEIDLNCGYHENITCNDPISNYQPITVPQVNTREQSSSASYKQNPVSYNTINRIDAPKQQQQTVDTKSHFAQCSNVNTEHTVEANSLTNKCCDYPDDQLFSENSFYPNNSTVYDLQLLSLSTSRNTKRLGRDNTDDNCTTNRIDAINTPQQPSLSIEKLLTTDDKPLLSTHDLDPRVTPACSLTSSTLSSTIYDRSAAHPNCLKSFKDFGKLPPLPPLFSVNDYGEPRII